MTVQALYSVEDARKKILNQYELALIAATRVRELGNSKTPGAATIALKEIAAGKLDMQYYKNSLKPKAKK